MALQGTGTSPKTKRSGIIPHSMRKTVIVCSIIALLITAVICGIGIWNNWAIFFNLIFLLIAVGSLIVGLLALWPSKGSDDESASVVPQQPLVEDRAPQHLPSPTLSAQTDEESEDADNLLRALIKSSPSIFDAVIAYYNPPSGVGETGTRANRARELVNTAVDRGDLPRLINAYYKAMGIKPSA